MALQEMENGAYFVKVKSKSWRKTRFIQLSPDHLSLEVLTNECFSKKKKISK